MQRTKIILLISLLGILLNSCSNSEEIPWLAEAREAIFSKNDSKLQELIASHPELVKGRYKNGHTLLTTAINIGNEKAVIFLLDNGADLHVRTTGNGLLPIDLASLLHDNNIYKLLKARGAQDNLITLILKGTDQEVKEFCANNKIPRNYFWGDEMTPVIAAIYAKKPETLKFLLQQGFPVIIPEKNISALRIAILTSSPQALGILLEHEISHNSMPIDKEKEYLFNIIQYAKKEKRKEIETVLASYIPKPKMKEKKENNRSADVLKPLTMD